jgi:TolA-binding protein
MPICALASCASARPAATTVDPEIAAQLRAMANRQAELEHKIERLEAKLDTARATAPRAAPVQAVAEPSRSTTLVPNNLQTIRLTPPKKAPPLPTEVTVRDPDPAAVEAMADRVAPGADASDFHLAMKAISTGEVERGAQALLDFAEKHPKDEQAPQALFQAGVGLLTFGDFAGAMMAFERLADDYPRASEAPEAMVKLAECNLRLKHPGEARSVYSRVVTSYPNTPAARAAEAGLKNLAAAPPPPEK